MFQIVFKRTANVNASLKVTQAKTGNRGISMAKGPDEGGSSSSIGFVTGWREHPQVAVLPWAHLLPHLALAQASSIDAFSSGMASSSS